MNSKLRKIFHSLLGELPLSDEDRKALKLAIVMDASKNRETSWNGLTDLEAQHAINCLKNQVVRLAKPQENGAINTPKNNDWISKEEFEKGEKMRRRILSMAHEMGWQIQGGKIDMQRVNGWCERYGGFKKVLNKHTYLELVKLTSGFETMLSKRN